MLDKIKGALGIYKEADSALPAEARAVRELSSDVYAKLQDLYVNAFVEADENYSGSSDIKYSERSHIQSEIVDLTDDNNLSNLIDGIHGASRYKLIAKYIMDILGNESIVLSDGKKAIVDRRDSTHIAAKAGKEKTAQISKIKEIIKKAKLYAEDKSAIHNKFSQFSYYRSIVKYNGDKYPIYVNVGLTHNDKTYHIYDITHKIRDTANRINGFEQPKINEGYALKNDISIDSIQQNADFVNGEKQNFEKNLSTESDTKFSLRGSLRNPYSYEALVSKPDMRIITLDETVPSNRADVVQLAKKNAATIGKINKDGSVSVHVNDIDADVILGSRGLSHSLDRRLNDIAPVTVRAGEILQNSVKINELIPSKKEADSSYVLIGVAENSNGELCIVRSVVNKFSNELDNMDVLYAINAKKGTAVLNAPLVSTPDYRTSISIAQLLEYVNKYFPDILPESVLRHYGYDARPKGELGENALYSARQTAMKEMRERLQANQVDTDKIIELADKYYKKTGGHMSKSRMRYKFLAIADQIMSDYDAAFEDIEALAEDIVNDPAPPTDIADTLKEIKAHVKNAPLWMTDHDKGEFGIYGGYNEFRKKNMGKLRLTNYGMSPDSLYLELQDVYGKAYFPDETTVAKMVIQIANVVNSDPMDYIDQFLYDDYYNVDDDYEFKVSSIANDLTEIIADSWKRGGLDFTELNMLKESDLQSDGKFSDRELLANALESAARSDSEKSMLSQYKKKIKRMSEEQKVLDNTKKVIKELSFKKGKRDTVRISTLKELVSKTENRINTYDRQLLRLESTSVLSEIIKRERQKAYEKANQVDTDNFEKLPSTEKRFFFLQC